MLEKSTSAQKGQIVVDEKEGHLAELDPSNFLTCECPQLEAACSKELVLIIVELRDKPSTLSLTIFSINRLCHSSASDIIEGVLNSLPTG